MSGGVSIYRPLFTYGFAIYQLCIKLVCQFLIKYKVWVETIVRLEQVPQGTNALAIAIAFCRALPGV